MKLILSLDGGGIRERFVVELLAHIEHATQIRIYDIFDLIVGVSAGAVAAAVIALQQYDDIKTACVVDPYEVFRERMYKNMGGIFSTVYSGDGKSSELQNMFGKKSMQNLITPTAILTVKMKTGEAVVFTNNDKDAGAISLASVVDASSAAPIFFPSIKVNGHHYIDGGFANNDPVFVGLEYAKQLWPLEDELAVLSIGTGSAADIDVDATGAHKFGLVKWLSEGLIGIMTESRRNYNEPVIRMLVGQDNYMRITSKTIGKTDDVSNDKSIELIEDAGEVWVENGSKILAFLKNHKR